MRITITGASGFVGRNLQRYLKDRCYQVRTVSLRNGDWKNDIGSEGDAIVHLAGKAHDTSNTTKPDEYFKVNRDLSIELYEEFLKSEFRDFFYLSSVKAVADTVEGVLVEDVDGNPYTPYGKSKLEAEQYLLSQKLPEGKRLFIIRPCMIHGPGNKGNLNLLYQIVEKGIPWPLAAFGNRRSFLSIDNLSFLIQQILANEKVPTGIYNFADDEPLSTNELVTLISETLGKTPRFWKISVPIVKKLVRIGDVFQLPLDSERLKKLTESYVVSNEKIKQTLGIEKLPLSVEEGLRATIMNFSERT